MTACVLEGQSLKYLTVKDGTLSTEGLCGEYNKECLQTTVKHGGGTKVFGGLYAIKVGI